MVSLTFIYFRCCQVFTWHGASLEVEGVPEAIYVADEVRVRSKSQGSTFRFFSIPQRTYDRLLTTFLGFRMPDAYGQLCKRPRNTRESAPGGADSRQVWRTCHKAGTGGSNVLAALTYCLLELYNDSQRRGAVKQDNVYTQTVIAKVNINHTHM